MSEIVELVMGYDEGTLTKGGLIRCGKALVETGLVNSTGSYQRFVAMLIEGGYIEPDGTITEKGQDIVDEDE